MTIIELIEKVGMENVRVQRLDTSMTDAAQRKDGATAITFLTKEISTTEAATGKARMHGLIVWLPKDKLFDVIAPIYK